MNIKLPLFALTIALLSFNCSHRISKTGSQHEKAVADDYTFRIDSLLQTKSPRSFNGVILITQKGKVKYSKAAGYSDFEKKVPLTLQDNFRIQSNSKQVTAVLVLREVEKGNIDLEKPVRTYLTLLQPAWADTVTIHQLLNMSAGITGLDKPLAFRPGTDFYYSNPAYGLLGQVIQKVTGKTYTQAANALFTELGMHNTLCYEIGKTTTEPINGYWLSKDSLELVNFANLNFTEQSWSNFVPAGGIISNAVDLNTWDTKLHNGKLLQPKSYAAMANSKVVDADYTFSDKKSNYGYGVNINEEEPVKYVGHSGRGIGFVSLKFYVPAKDLDVIILENVYNRDVSIVYHFEKAIRQIVMSSRLIK